MEDYLKDRPDETWTQRWRRLGFNVEWLDAVRAYLVVRSDATGVDVLTSIRAFKTVQEVDGYVRMEVG